MLEIKKGGRGAACPGCCGGEGSCAPNPAKTLALTPPTPQPPRGLCRCRTRRRHRYFNKTGVAAAQPSPRATPGRETEQGGPGGFSLQLEATSAAGKGRRSSTGQRAQGTGGAGGGQAASPALEKGGKNPAAASGTSPVATCGRGSPSVPRQRRLCGRTRKEITWQASLRRALR